MNIPAWIMFLYKGQSAPLLREIVEVEQTIVLEATPTSAHNGTMGLSYNQSELKKKKEISPRHLKQ